jgi:hypothetical protein
VTANNIKHTQMTKVTIIGDKPKTHKYSGIRFMKCLNTSYKMVNGPYGFSPSIYDEIELITRDYTNTRIYGGKPGMDLMFAYTAEGRSAGSLFLGWFNDGIVLDRNGCIQ